MYSFFFGGTKSSFIYFIFVFLYITQNNHVRDGQGRRWGTDCFEVCRGQLPLVLSYSVDNNSWQIITCVKCETLKHNIYKI